MRQAPPAEGRRPDAAPDPTPTGASAVSDQRLETNGESLTGEKLGPVDVLTYRMNGVEAQFDLNAAAVRRYHDLRPRQWSGTEAIWIKRGDILGGKWELKSQSRGAGDDSPLPENVLIKKNVIAFYDSPGPNVAGYLASRPSRIHVIQNFTSWIEGKPRKGGPPERLNEVLPWHSVVSLADENWGKKTPKWVRVHGNRAGTGWADTKKHPQV